MFSAVKADQVTIGSLSDATAHSYLPWNSYYKYGFTQQLYTPEEIGVSGTINSITLQLSNEGSASLLSNFAIEIYMAEVSKESFAGSDWVALSASDLVYSGTVDLSNLTSTAEAVTFTLTNAFTYSGTGNLLVAFRNNTGSYKTGLRGAAFTSEDNLAIYAQRDSGGEYDIADPGVTGSTTTSRDVITLDMNVSGTLTVCQQPTLLEATDVAARQATLNWAGGSTDTYNVEYKLASLADEDRNWTQVLGNTTLTSTTLTGLTPNTAYNARVHCVCADGVSKWKTVNFTTTIGIPYSENFDAATAIPTAWKQYTGLLANVMAGTASLSTTTYGWSFSSSTTGIFESKHIYTNIYGTSRKNWLVLPVVPIEENTQLTFNVALSKSSSAYTAAATTGTDDKFVVLATVDNGETWIILRQWDNAGSEYVYNNIALYGEEVALDLSDYAGMGVQIAFYGESTVSNADNYLHIDDVLIDYIPSCLKPSDLHMVNGSATKNSIQVAWTANSGEENWKIQYKKKADTEWTTVDNVTANPFTITDLESFTEYNVQVAAFCDPTDESTLTDYCKPIVVKTASGVPYHEGFNASTWPADWKRYEAYLTDVQNGAELTAVSTGWATKAKASAN